MIAKLTKEKKGVEDNLAERTEQLQTAEDKVTQLNKAKGKLEGQVKDVSYSLFICCLGSVAVPR